MKQSNQNAIRESISAALLEHFSAQGEDVAMITSGSFNFPVVYDGEEGFVEIVVKVPKYDSDEGYALREDYQLNLKAKAEKKAESAKKKAEKIAKDTAERERKKREREARKAQ